MATRREADAAMRTGLVGRETELAVLSECLEAVLEGHPRMVICVGEPGIGKSRLAEELLTLAAARDVLGVWGVAVDSVGAPPYWPWPQVLRGIGSRVDLPSIAAEYRLTTDLARLAPDMFPESGNTMAAGSVEDRFRLFDAVAVLLWQVTRAHPLVIVLDDMQAADHASLLLLHHVARSMREGRWLVVVNYRDTEQTDGALLAELLREPVTRQLRLGGLAVPAVATQLSATLGHDVSDADVSQVYELTGGNPFFVAEVGRALADRLDGVPASPVTLNLRAAIGVRLSRLSADAARFLQAASIAGREFSVTVVAAMVDMPVIRCLGLVDEATTAGLVGAASSSGRHRFAHALTRDAIEAGLSTPERVRLHRLAAQALEQLYGAGLEAHVFELAQHWAVAAVEGDRTRAAGWIERAGNEAMRRHAYEEGARLFRLSLDTGAEHLDQAARCRILVALGGALYWSSDLAAGLDACGQAAALGAEIRRPDLVAQAALVTEPTFDPEIDLVIRQLCEKAIAAIGCEPAALRARVMARFAQVCDYLADVEPAGAASSEALILAEESGEPAALFAALHSRQMVCSGPDGLEERTGIAERLLALARDTSNPQEQLWAHLWRVDVAFERGDFGRVTRELDSVTRLAGEIGGPLARWQLLRCQAMLAQAQARFDDARRLTDEAFTTAALTGHPAAGLIRGAQLMAVAQHTGHDAGSISANGVAAPGTPVKPFQTAGVIGHLAFAEILTQLGRTREAAAIYRSLGAVEDWRVSPHSTLATYKSGICVAAAVDRPDHVAVLRDLLSRYRGHHVISGAGPLGYFGPVGLWLGIAAVHLDLLDDAVADLEHAVKDCAVSGATGFHTEAQYELANALALRASPGDATRARLLATDTATKAESLGMSPVAAKANRLIQHVDRHSSTALTPREREVAELVGQGLTNRKIAARLYLSERTVENHVQHILTKLDLPNRSQIAIWISSRR